MGGVGNGDSFPNGTLSLLPMASHQYAVSPVGTPTTENRTTMF